MWRYRRNKGYILLETCLAIFFITIGLVVVSGAIVSSLGGIRFSQNYLLAGYLVEEKIGEDRLTGEVEDGACDIFSWKIEKDIDEENKLAENTITVMWLEKNRANTQAFSYTLPYEE